MKGHPRAGWHLGWGRQQDGRFLHVDASRLKNVARNWLFISVIRCQATLKVPENGLDTNLKK